MKPTIVLLAIILCAAVVTGRNLHDVNPENEDSDSEYRDKPVRDHTNSQMRNRRRARHSYYNDFNSYNPYDDYFERRRDERRDYSSRQQEELLSRILNQIEEISIYIKKTQTPSPPVPPQIIYIPVLYPVPQYFNGTKPFVPNFNDRLPEMDKNQNWGLIPGDLGLDSDDGGDSSRPINLDPILTEDEDTVKPPSVEHGTNQAGLITTPKPTARTEPGRCKAAILVCCQDTSELQKQKCFLNYGCSKTYSISRACQPNVIKRVIAEFAETYGPINYA